MAHVAAYIACLQAYGEPLGVKSEPMAALLVQPAILPPNIGRRGYVPLFLWDALRFCRYHSAQLAAHPLLLLSLTSHFHPIPAKHF